MHKINAVKMEYLLANTDNILYNENNTVNELYS